MCLDASATPQKIRIPIPQSFALLDGSEFQVKVLKEFRKQFTEKHPEFTQRVTNGIIHFGDDIEINQLLACPGNLDRHPGNQAWRSFLYQRIALDGAAIPIPHLGRGATIRYDGPPYYSPGRENTYTEMVFLEHMRLLSEKKVRERRRRHEEESKAEYAAYTSGVDDNWSVRATYRGE